MTISDAGDIVVVPFPFSDLPVAKPRPALVVSASASNDREGTTLLAMITTASGSKPGDTPVQDGEQAGLKAASVLRLKLFTLDNRLIARRIGSLTARDRRAARVAVSRLFAL